MPRGPKPKDKPRLRGIDPTARLEDLQELYGLLLADIRADGVKQEIRNGMIIKNPSISLLCSVNDRIRRLQQDLQKVDAKPVPQQDWLESMSA